MILTLALVLQLAAACAPTVAPETIAAVARTESGFDPLAIGDNSTGRSYSPSSVAEAIALASSLRLQGHSIDLGLMQINSANRPGLGLSIADAFDACRSIAAGARILTDAYAGGATPAEAQAAVRVALSRYNTGNPQRGFANGYVRRVEASAAYLVPALRMEGSSALPAPAARLSTIRANPSAVPHEANGEWHASAPARLSESGGAGEWHAPSRAGSTSDAEPSREGITGSPLVILKPQNGSTP